MITGALVAFLTHHLAPSKVMAADLDTMISAQTVQGEVFNIASRIGVKVNDATVIQANVKCTNGVIHGIDTILTPKWRKRSVCGTALHIGDRMTKTPPHLRKAYSANHTQPKTIVNAIIADKGDVSAFADSDTNSDFVIVAANGSFLQGCE